jgi:hypothetical protein
LMSGDGASSRADVDVSSRASGDASARAGGGASARAGGDASLMAGDGASSRAYGGASSRASGGASAGLAAARARMRPAVARAREAGGMAGGGTSAGCWRDGRRGCSPAY